MGGKRRRWRRVWKREGGREGRKALIAKNSRERKVLHPRTHQDFPGKERKKNLLYANFVKLRRDRETVVGEKNEKVIWRCPLMKWRKEDSGKGGLILLPLPSHPLLKGLWSLPPLPHGRERENDGRRRQGGICISLSCSFPLPHPLNTP